MPRNWSGWIVLAILFGLLIPATMVQSFAGTDANSTDPAVQAGNLEAIVRDEKPGALPRAKLQRVIEAVRAKHWKNEDAAAVYAGAMRELQNPLTVDDLAPLATSKLEGRRTVARLYATPPPSPARVHALLAKLPKDRFLYQLARAQSLESIGDRSARSDLSPDTEPKTARPGVVVLSILLVFGFAVGSVLIFAYLAGLASGSLKWQGHPLEPRTDGEADALAVRASQLFAVFLFAELGVGAIVAGMASIRTPTGVLAAGVASSAAVIFGTLVVTWMPLGGRPYRLADYGVSKAAVKSALGWGIAGLFAVVPLATVGALLGVLVEGISPRPDHPLVHLLEDPHNLVFVAGAFFMASMQAPFTEELLFRGTLVPALSGLFRRFRHGTPIAIGVAALLFAAIHPQGLSMWLPLASVGFVNGVLCYQTRSVLPGMVMHALFNMCALAATLFVR